MQVHLLYVGTYDDTTVIGVYVSAELAEREIIRRAYAGESLEGVQIRMMTVVES